jgi:hypothetical protein
VHSCTTTKALVTSIGNLVLRMQEKKLRVTQNAISSPFDICLQFSMRFQHSDVCHHHCRVERIEEEKWMMCDKKSED